MVEAIERDRELGERLTAGIAYAGDRIDLLEPAARGVLGRPQMLEDRRHVREGRREVGPAGDAHQAHGAPIDKDGEQRQEILDLGPLEQAAQKQHRHAEPFEVLPDRRQLLVAGAENRLVTIGVALAAKLLNRVGQGHLLLLGALDGAQLGLLTMAVAIRVETALRVAGAHRDREAGKAGDDLRHRAIVALQPAALAAGKVLLPKPGHVEGRRTSKPIDRLLGVADHPEIAAIGPQRVQQAHAAAVHVLILIDQDVIILRLQRCADRRIFLEQLHRQGDEVAEVDAMRVALELFIGRVDTGHLAGALGSFARLRILRFRQHRTGKRGVGFGVDDLVLRPRDGGQHVGDDLGWIVEIAVVRRASGAGTPPRGARPPRSDPSSAGPSAGRAPHGNDG